jgi:LuxR family transcriptional regulator, maltose regulon positive regulatory protein
MGPEVRSELTAGGGPVTAVRGEIVSRRGLFGRLGAAGRVMVVSAPAGSGKTVLVRSWLSAAGLAGRAGWVPVLPGEGDEQRFWVSVLDALRQTPAGAELVRPVTAAPDLDGWAMTERLLKDLAPLAERLWLVIDDVHELRSAQTLRQLQLLVLRAPPGLRLVLVTRQDPRLGLHRLRLEGELTEIREPDLRFTVAEAGELFDAAGVKLAGPALASLVERTEGWVAGLRLAALSLAGHPDPGRFAAGFSGTERTVAEYLLAEVLDRQPDPVRRLLLRTSVLDRLNGELADLLTGGSGGERVLQDLEEANAFVVAVDAARSWFRYHHLFAGLLQLELRRTAVGEVTGLHRAAARWFADHGFAVEAIRHAQAARDWDLAAGLLASHWPGLYLDGKDVTARELLAGFPAEAATADAGLATVAAADQLAWGSLAAAERYITLAERDLAAAPAGQHAQAQMLLGIVRLSLARQRGNPQTVAQQAERLRAFAEAPEAAQYDLVSAARAGLGEELRALALLSLGITEFWAAGPAGAERHLEQGRVLAHRIGRPFLEFSSLAYQAATELYRSFARAEEYSMPAIELAERHGWTDEPATGIACLNHGAVLAWQGRLEEAGPWVQRAERVLRAEAEPAAVLGVQYTRGLLELGRGRHAEALAVFQAAERLAGGIASPQYILPAVRALLVYALVRLGETERAEQALAGFGDQDRGRGEVRIVTAVLRLAQDDPRAALAVLAPVLDGSAPLLWPTWRTLAFLLEASARDALGDEGAADQAVERALDCAEPDGVLLFFLLHPAPGLLARHARHRTAHAALLAGILSLLAGTKTAPPPAGPRPLYDPLRGSELQVLRYLPTSLSVPEIAGQLYLSVNTVKTHMRNLYGKLGVHRRHEAVERARALGLLAPSPRRPGAAAAP